MKLENTYFQLLANNEIAPYDITPTLMDYHSSKDFDKLLALCDSLKTNNSVKLLDLCDCDLSDDELIQILSRLKENKSIEKLSLHNNKLTDKSIDVIASFLTMKELTSITLHENSFTEDGLEKLKRTLLNCPTLQYVTPKALISHRDKKEPASPSSLSPHSIFSQKIAVTHPIGNLEIERVANTINGMNENEIQMLIDKLPENKKLSIFEALNHSQNTIKAK